ncbi:MAG: FtsX-like permease family protein [Coleofasciculaceae cyanobacterium SM2_3_26]|nr:FtsX-like permease family protein [Coleofasciculaceae cyanobacterium SM2_3_26]
MVSIARKNLFEDVPRLLVAQAGIMFAVSLVTIQTGIFNGVIRSTALLVDRSTADIWVASEETVYLELATPLPVEYLLQAREVAGVRSAEALLLSSVRWIKDGRIVPMRVIGFNPSGQLFSPWNVIAGDPADLQQPYTIAVDSASLDSLQIDNVGQTGTVSSIPTKIVAIAEGTQSILSSSFMYTSLENANAYITAGLRSSVVCESQGGTVRCTNVYEQDADAPSPETPRSLKASDSITYILVSVEPGQNVAEIRQRLEGTLTGVKTYTTAEMAENTRDYWKRRTAIGFILGLGAAVGIFVGIVVVGQILYSSVADHIKEFGTLKAMGASDWVIYSVILEQAFWMAVLGYFPGMGLCFGIAAIAYSTQGIAILITPVAAASVFGITVAICTGASLFAIQRVTRIDPAIVFKA